MIPQPQNNSCITNGSINTLYTNNHSVGQDFVVRGACQCCFQKLLVTNLKLI